MVSLHIWMTGRQYRIALLATSQYLTLNPTCDLAETSGVTPADPLMASMAAGPNMPNLRNFKRHVDKWYFCEFV